MIAPQLKNLESVDNINGMRREHIQRQRNETLASLPQCQEGKANVPGAMKLAHTPLIPERVNFTLTNK